MLALASHPEAPYAQLREVADPVPLPDEAVVEVKAISLNRGECRRLSTMAEGSVTGWDLAGEVVQPAADGSDPSSAPGWSA